MWMASVLANRIFVAKKADTQVRPYKTSACALVGRTRADAGPLRFICG